MPHKGEEGSQDGLHNEKDENPEGQSSDKEEVKEEDDGHSSDEAGAEVIDENAPIAVLAQPLPVVDQDKQLAGIISWRDLLKYFCPDTESAPLGTDT